MPTLCNEETSAYSPYRWYIHILTVSYFLMGFIVRFSWPPLASAAAFYLGMDMTMVGSYMSAFYAGYVLIHIPAGILGDRFGARRVITLALLVEGIASIGMGTAESYAGGFVLRVLAGLGAGMVYAACVRTVVRSFPPKEQSLAFGFLLIAPTGGGVLLTNLLMPWLATFWAWRGAFITVGAIALILSAVAFLSLRDTGSPTRQDHGENIFSGLKFVLGHRALVMVSVAGFFLMLAQVSFVSWGNSYLKSINFTLTEAGLVMVIFGIGGCAGPLAAGMICAKIAQPKWVLAVDFLVAIPLLPIFGLLESMSGLMISAGFLGFFLGMGNTPINVIIGLFAGKDRSATASGVFGCIAQSGAMLGPLVIGYSIDITGSYTFAWWIMAISCAIGIAMLLPIPQPPTKNDINFNISETQ